MLPLRSSNVAILDWCSARAALVTKSRQCTSRPGSSAAASGVMPYASGLTVMRRYRYVYFSHATPSRTLVTVPSTASALRLSTSESANLDSIGTADVSMPK